MPIIHFVISPEDDLKVKALMPVLKTKARTRVYRKALEIAYNQFLIAGQIKPGPRPSP